MTNPTEPDHIAAARRLAQFARDTTGNPRRNSEGITALANAVDALCNLLTPTDEVWRALVADVHAVGEDKPTSAADRAAGHLTEATGIVRNARKVIAHRGMSGAPSDHLTDAVEELGRAVGELISAQRDAEVVDVEIVSGLTPTRWVVDPEHPADASVERLLGGGFRARVAMPGGATSVDFFNFESAEHALRELISVRNERHPMFRPTV